MASDMPERLRPLVLEVGASSVWIVQLPEGIPARWDLADPVPDGVDVERLLADAVPVVVDPSKVGGDEDGDGQRTPASSSGDRLLQWASDSSELFCDGEATFADVWMDGHRETLPVRSKGFRRWLRRLYTDRTGKGATQEAMTHAEENLDAQAAGAGQRRVYLRTAKYGGKLYIDLCDDARRVVEVDSEGWRVLSHHPEVRFRRPKTARPLPEPSEGGRSGGARRPAVLPQHRRGRLCALCRLALGFPEGHGAISAAGAHRGAGECEEHGGEAPPIAGGPCPTSEYGDAQE